MHLSNPGSGRPRIGARVASRLSSLLARSANALPAICVLPIVLVATSAAAQQPAAAAAKPAPAKPAAPSSAPGAAAAATPAGGAKAAPKHKAHLRACPPHIPEELNPPADTTLEVVLPANGVQSYACGVDKPGEAPDWQPKGPHANLGEGTNVVGIHFGGPSWQGLDGSMVKGTKVASAPSPDKSAVTWLLLSGAATGEGVFGKITHIQRLETVGGKPPTIGCDASHLDTKVLVPYRAYYYFYRLSEPGEKVQQCHSVASKEAASKAGPPKQASAKPTAEKQK